MTMQQKLDRLKKEGYAVRFRPCRKKKYVARKNGQVVEAKNIYQLFKTIFGY